MAYEIIGETIKSATSIKLGDIFKIASTNQQGQTIYTYPKRYKENVTKPSYPSFWIIEVNLAIKNTNTDNKSVLNKQINRVQLDYLMNIQYRVAENTESITNLQQQLDSVGLQLMANFNELDLELPVKVYNKNFEKADGVGQFTFNVSVFAKPEAEQQQTMEDLSLSENIL